MRNKESKYLPLLSFLINFVVLVCPHFIANRLFLQIFRHPAGDQHAAQVEMQGYTTRIFYIIL